ncbi:hypothetical protein CFN78_12725 [Amycolatopsis antarctica]|uniref:Uncharacterized protein n=1 Tax=Amycolatopsis antarctica TaxID=1854586 RepID=A0A263D3L3_9PSEU|nr:hypothetical protein [Amycolatopsis antarctica]OZM73074.1 hypothetical protein CFN78_12725 [Amycolatopsis antarctica]
MSSTSQRTARAGLVGFYVSWFGLTVLKQFPGRRIDRFLGKIDPTCTALPVSTFFAPRPGNTDIHILFHDLC